MCMCLSGGNPLKTTITFIQPNCDIAFISVIFESLTFITVFLSQKTIRRWECSDVGSKPSSAGVTFLKC